MVSLDPGGPHGSGQLRWGVRTYAGVLVLCILAVGLAIPWLLRQSVDEVYEAEALVVARTSEMPLTAMPRYAEAVFYNGVVARRVAAEINFDGDPKDLVPDHLSVVTGQDSIVMTVVARNGDPSVASEMANEAAATYVAELNKPGPQLATFAVQNSSVPPQSPISSGPSTALMLVVGLGAGSVLGLGLIALLLAVRRPVVDVAHFEQIAGAPVVATLDIPRRGSARLEPQSVPGLGVLARRLLDLQRRQVQLVAPHERARLRRQVVDLLQTAVDRRHGRDVATGPGARPEALTVLEVPQPVDAIADASSTATFLLLDEGVRERRVTQLLSEYLDLEVSGVIVVRPRLPSVRVVALRPSAGAPAAPKRPVSRTVRTSRYKARRRRDANGVDRAVGPTASS